METFANTRYTNVRWHLILSKTFVLLKTPFVQISYENTTALHLNSMYSTHVFLQYMYH